MLPVGYRMLLLHLLVFCLILGPAIAQIDDGKNAAANNQNDEDNSSKVCGSIFGCIFGVALFTSATLLFLCMGLYSTSRCIINLSNVIVARCCGERVVPLDQTGVTYQVQGTSRLITCYRATFRYRTSRMPDGEFFFSNANDIGENLYLRALSGTLAVYVPTFCPHPNNVILEGTFLFEICRGIIFLVIFGAQIPFAIFCGFMALTESGVSEKHAFGACVIVFGICVVTMFAYSWYQYFCPVIWTELPQSPTDNDEMEVDTISNDDADA